MGAVSFKYYVCKTNTSWTDDECHLLASKVLDQGFRLLERAAKALHKESTPKDGAGWFDLRVLKSDDDGVSFKQLSLSEYIELLDFTKEEMNNDKWRIEGGV